ncbi:MAG: VTT domain-containing protein [Rhodospirillaceae bacterium]
MKLILRSGVLLASLIAVVVLIRVAGLNEVLGEAWIDHYVRGHGAAGVGLLIVMGAVSTGIGLPRQVISFLAGYAFGLAAGTAVGVVATAGGCALTFYYARFMGRDLVAQKLPGRVKRIDGFLAENPFSMTLLIRFLPVGSNLVTNLAAGVSSVPFMPFFAGSAIGYVPQTLIFALVGTGIKVDPATNIAVAAGLFVLSGLCGVYLYRRYRQDRIYEEDIEVELDPNKRQATE